MRITLLSFVCMIFLLSCNEKKEAAPVSSANEKLVQQYFDHFNKHDWGKLAAMYTDTADFKDPALGSGVIKQTTAQISSRYMQLNSFFPDLSATVSQVYPSGDKHVVVEFVSKGSSADGMKIELPICVIFTIENGKITKDYSYYDNAS